MKTLGPQNGIVQRQDQRDNIPESARNLPRGYRCVGRVGEGKLDGVLVGQWIYSRGTDAGDLGWTFWAPEIPDGDVRDEGAWAHAWPTLSRAKPQGRQGGGTRSTSYLGNAGSTRFPASDETVHVRPVWGLDWDRDEGFAEKRTGRHPDWPDVPGGTVGLVVSGTRTTSQEPLWLHTDPRMVAANRAGSPAMSSVVYDIDDEGEYDEDRRAPLHSMMRVIRPSDGVPGGSPPVGGLAWQLAPGGLDGIPGGGLTYDTPDGSAFGRQRGRGQDEEDDEAGDTEVIPLDATTVLFGAVGGTGIVSMTTSREGGPFDVARGAADPHRLATTLDGEPVISQHLSTFSLFYGLGGDAPLAFESDPYEPADKAPYLVETHLRNDPASTHLWRGGSLPGLWRLESESFLRMPPAQPPVLPPQPDPPDLPPVINPPVEGGPPNVPDFPDSPLRGTGNSPAPPPELPPVFTGSTGSNLSTRQHCTPPLQTHLDMASPGWLAQPQEFWGGANDLRRQRTLTSEDVASIDNRPIVGRMDAFGRQTSTRWDLNFTPNNTRCLFPAGTTDGGWVMTGPETSLSEILDGTFPTLENRSTTCLIAGPDTRIGWGFPDVTTGCIKKGHDFRSVDDATCDGRTDLKWTNSSGTEISVASICDGTWTFVTDLAVTGCIDMLSGSGIAEYCPNYASVTHLTGTTTTPVFEGKAGAGGDPFMRLAIGSARSYAFGPDDDDGDILKLGTAASGSAVITDNVMLVMRPTSELGIGGTPDLGSYLHIVQGGSVTSRFESTGSDVQLLWESDSAGGGSGPHEMAALLDTSGDLNIKDGGTTALVIGNGATFVSAEKQFRTKANTPAQITANQDDYDVGDTAFARLDSDASRNITGISGGVDGRRVTLYNIGSFDIVLKNQDAASTAGNRFLFTVAADITLAAGQPMDIIYDDTTDRWRDC